MPDASLFDSTSHAALTGGLTPEVSALLDRRARRLREQPAGTDDEALLWVAEFPLGEERFAISLDALRGAVPVKLVTPLPLAPPYVIGILRFQGQILSALSLAALLGVRGWRQDPAVLLVLDAGMGHLCAVDCEQIPKPSVLPLSAVEAARASARSPVIEVTTRQLEQISLIDDLGLLLTAHATGLSHAP